MDLILEDTWLVQKCFFYISFEKRFNMNLFVVFRDFFFSLSQDGALKKRCVFQYVAVDECLSHTNLYKYVKEAQLVFF